MKRLRFNLVKFQKNKSKRTSLHLLGSFPVTVSSQSLDPFKQQSGAEPELPVFDTGPASRPPGHHAQESELSSAGPYVC